MWQALLVCCASFGDTTEVRTHFQQVHPAQVAPGPIMPAEMDFRRTPGRAAAVVLIHGFHVGATNYQVRRPQIEAWQQSDSWLVSRLGEGADVYAFRYGQNVRVEEIARLPALRAGVKRLKQLGYGQVVLIGHSAGGLVARHFVEDYPDAGVTKVMQVCAPNGGSKWADLVKFVKLPLVPNATQRPFVYSLTIEERVKTVAGRQGKKVPASVQFLCVVGSADWVVSPSNQWTPDLRAQGISAIQLPLAHETAMYGEENSKRLCDLLALDQPNLGLKQVQALSTSLVGTESAGPPGNSPSLILDRARLDWLRPVTGPRSRPRMPIQVGGK